MTAFWVNPTPGDGIWDSYPRKQLQLPHDIVAVLLVMALARDIQTDSAAASAWPLRGRPSYSSNHLDTAGVQNWILLILPNQASNARIENRTAARPQSAEPCRQQKPGTLRYGKASPGLPHRIAKELCRPLDLKKTRLDKSTQTDPHVTLENDHMRRLGHKLASEDMDIRPSPALWV